MCTLALLADQPTDHKQRDGHTQLQERDEERLHGYMPGAVAAPRCWIVTAVP